MPTLLLADDSVAIWRVVELTFADEDVRVVTVQNGERAIACLEAERPDIVLADIAMPRVDGYDVASYIKQSATFRHIPVLLLAGEFDRIDEDKARATGCDGVLVKPFEPQVLVARVRELLAGSRSPALWPADLPRVVSAIRPPVIAASPPALKRVPSPKVAPFVPSAAVLAMRSTTGRTEAPTPDAFPAPPPNAPIPFDRVPDRSAQASMAAAPAFESALDQLDEAFAKLEPSAPPARLDKEQASEFARDLETFRNGANDEAGQLPAEGTTRPTPPSLKASGGWPGDPTSAVRPPLDVNQWGLLKEPDRPSAPVSPTERESASVPSTPAPATQRLKIKVGSSEFEAEGSPDAVQAQFEYFKQMVGLATSTPPVPPAATPGSVVRDAPAPDPVQGSIGARLSAIMKVDDDVVSLTVGGNALDEVILLMLYGQRTLRDNDAVTSEQVLAGLTAMGGVPVKGGERLLNKAVEAGHVSVTGQGQGKRYRLTGEGLSKARALANALLSR